MSELSEVAVNFYLNMHSRKIKMVVLLLLIVPLLSELRLALHL